MQCVLFYCNFSVFHSLQFYQPMFVLFGFMGSISKSSLGVIMGFCGCEFQRAFQWVFGYLIFLISRGHSIDLSVFCGSVGFHWVWDFSIDLFCSIISLCCRELNFFVYISSMEQLQVAKKFCLLCYRINNQCVFVFLNKDFA